MLGELFDLFRPRHQIVNIERRDATVQPTDKDSGDLQHGLVDEIGRQSPLLPDLRAEPRLDDDHATRQRVASKGGNGLPQAIHGFDIADGAAETLEAQMTAEQWTAYAAFFQPVPEALAGYSDLEFTDLDLSASQVRDATDALPLPPCPQSPGVPFPLVVLSRGRSMAMPSDLPGGLTGEGLERAWTAEQDRLATLVPGARHVIARESEHDIQLQQPELVIDAVRQVVEAVRDPSSWAMSVTGTPNP